MPERRSERCARTRISEFPAPVPSRAGIRRCGGEFSSCTQYPPPPIHLGCDPSLLRRDRDSSPAPANRKRGCTPLETVHYHPSLGFIGNAYTLLLPPIPAASAPPS